MGQITCLNGVMRVSSGLHFDNPMQEDSFATQHYSDSYSYMYQLYCNYRVIVVVLFQKCLSFSFSTDTFSFSFSKDIDLLLVFNTDIDLQAISKLLAKMLFTYAWL